jgi:hypothetical protein
MMADANLEEFYQNSPKPSNPEERLLFIEAISRLSEALAIIHNRESSEPEEGSATYVRIRDYQRDLKYSQLSNKRRILMLTAGIQTYECPLQGR